MTKRLDSSLNFFLMLFLTLLITRCGNKHEQSDANIVDSVAITRGKEIFTQQCTSCHTIEHDAIGPALGGITSVAKEDWIKRFIKNPKRMIDGGDERAAVIFEKYRVYMPAFPSLTDEQVTDLLAWLRTTKGTEGKVIVDSLALKNPIPESIPMSPLVVKLKEIAVIPPSSKEGQLTRICKLDFRPDTKELFVVDLRGKLYRLKNGSPQVFLDMAAERPNFINKPGLATGFGSFAFHPEFKKNGLLYTTHSERASSAPADFTFNDSIKVTLQWVLTEWRADNPNAIPFKGKSRELMRINMVHGIHGVQEISFNPFAKKGDEDYGLLYIGVGEGGSVEYGFPFITHSKEKIWGTIIRIDPSGHNSKNGKYGIPQANPFVADKNENTVREIYAWGFRNPHRISWTRSGLMLASNIGQHNIEALNLIAKGHDYGWPQREGSFVLDINKGMNNIYPLPENDSINHFTYPVAQYDHNEGNAISGGYEYFGNTINALKGKYLFGDIVNGRLFFIETKSILLGKQAPISECQVSFNGKITTLSKLCGADKVDLRFGRDAAGEIYILTKPDGKIYKLIP